MTFKSLSIINKYFSPRVKTVTKKEYLTVLTSCMSESHSAKVHYLSFVIKLKSPHSLIVFF